MNHSFNASITNPDSCTICKYPEVAHSNQAICEAGGCKSGPTKVEIRYGNMLMCEVCWERELEITKKHMSPEAQKARLNAYLAQTRAVDEKAQLKSDIFVAQTTAAVDIKAAIYADTTLDELQKGHLYAKTCMDRFVTLQKTVFDKRTALNESMQDLNRTENEMRMWQVQVRTVASLLSTELREQFKASDVTYQPEPVKKIKPEPTKGSKKKYEREEVTNAAAKYGVPMAAIQFFVTSKNMSPDEAGIHLKTIQDKVKGTV